MLLTCGNYKIAIVIAAIFLNHLLEAQTIDLALKSSTNKQKSIPVRTYEHIPKYSKYKTEGERSQCNYTFHLLHYSIYNPKKECGKYSSIVLGLEELMLFIYEIRSSSTHLGEMVFLLRNGAEKDTKFRVDYAEFHPDFNLDISLKKTTTMHENHVVCVKFNCPTTISTSSPCPPILKPMINHRDDKTNQSSWFKIGLSLIIILVLVIIAVLIYLIASFYPKWDKSPSNLLIERLNGKEEIKPCSSFDAYDFLRKMEHIQPSLSDTYAKPSNFHESQNLSDNNEHNQQNGKSNTSLIIMTGDESSKAGNHFNPKMIDHLELLNNKVKTMPLIKKRYNHDSSRSTGSPEYSLMDHDLSNISSRTNPSFRSVKYIPPLKLVENEF